MLAKFIKSTQKSNLINISQRFEGQRVHYPTYAHGNMIPNKEVSGRQSGDCLDESEVVTRIMFVLNQF